MVDSANDQAVWFFASGSAGEPNTAVAWNYRYGVWYVWTPMPFGHVIETDTAASAALLLAGESLTTTGGFVYKFLSGNSFNGATISAIWMTKTLYGLNEQGQPLMSNTKRWRWLDTVFKVTAAVTLKLEWLTGHATDTADAVSSTDFAPAAETLVTSVLSTILTAADSEIAVALGSAQSKIRLQTGSGDFLYDEGIRIRVKTNATTAPWALEAMQLAFQVLPGLNRRDQ